MAYDVVLALADRIPVRVDLVANGDIIRGSRRIDGGGIIGVLGTDVLALASIDCRCVSEGEQRQKGGGNDEVNHDVVSTTEQ